MTFRDPAARDAAWGRYYRKRGLAAVQRAKSARDLRPTPGPIRRAIYETRRALAQLVRC